jgi:hypothetical protein
MLLLLLQGRCFGFSPGGCANAHISSLLPLLLILLLLLLPMHQGFAVVDGVFGPSLSSAFREELLGLYGGGAMTLNHTHLVKHNTTQLLPKTAIYESELSLDPKVRSRGGKGTGSASGCHVLSVEHKVWV